MKDDRSSARRHRKRKSIFVLELASGETVGVDAVGEVVEAVGVRCHLEKKIPDCLVAFYHEL
jgi:hypothetical protein